MRVRLFWQLLVTFAVVIVFGVGGTVGVILVRFAQISENARPEARTVNRLVWSAYLERYYSDHGKSWTGVDSWLHHWHDQGPFRPGRPPRYEVRDRDGRVVAGVDTEEPPIGSSNEPLDTFPLMLDGERIGTLHLSPEQPLSPPAPIPVSPARASAPPDRGDLIQAVVEPAIRTEYQQRVGRSFILAAVVIGTMTLGLAVIMSRRISAPLAGLTTAAQRVAGGDLGVAVNGSSIKEVDAVARAFNTMAETLRHEDQLRRNMTADIAHELRTPLTIIKGKLEGILDGVYPATAAHLMPVLEETVLLERLVEDLRLLSLAEAHQLPLHLEEVDLADILHATQRNFEREARELGIDLHLSIATDALYVRGDAQRLQQVFGNLVTNSLRYTPAGGRIVLSAERRDKNVRITVHDTGSGIAPDDLPHIFDRFWRGSKSRTRQGNGAGLGLAIARHLIEAHGGRIEVASTVGQGTSFLIEIALVPATDRPAVAEAAISA
jgi:signal transduction histidine kinase